MERTTQWIAVLAVLGMALFASRADAVVLVTTCSQTCTANCELQNNLSCNGQSGIVLNNGADLEMAGHFLTCTSSCPNAAITIGAGGTIVHNDAGNAAGVEGGIDSHFNIGVQCAGKTGSTLRGIRIEDATTGAIDCAKVQDSVFIGGGGALTFAISTGGVASTDYIRDNYFDNWREAIYVDSTVSTNMTIEHNQIVVRDVNVGGGGASEVGIDFQSGLTGNIDLRYNAFYGDPAGGDMIYYSSGPVSFVGNRCDPDSTACAACQTSTYCSSPITPFN